MHKDNIGYGAIVTADMTDEECEDVAYAMKTVRNLKKLHEIIFSGRVPALGSKENMTLLDVLEEVFNAEAE
jgi:hypothetical protein